MEPRGRFKPMFAVPASAHPYLVAKRRQWVAPGASQGLNRHQQTQSREAATSGDTAHTLSPFFAACFRGRHMYLQACGRSYALPLLFRFTRFRIREASRFADDVAAGRCRRHAAEYLHGCMLLSPVGFRGGESCVVFGAGNIR